MYAAVFVFVVAKKDDDTLHLLRSSSSSSRVLLRKKKCGWWCGSGEIRELKYIIKCNAVSMVGELK